MQEILQQILNGNFDYENCALDFSCSKLEIVISAGESYESSFHIFSAPGFVTNGFVMSSDLRMECLTDKFSGSDEEIAFCFHGENMEEGDVVKGVFYVVSNHGEYYLPFVVSVEYGVLTSSIGPIKNLFHFTNLAKSDWKEALELFYSPSFKRLFEGSDEGLLDTYRGLSAYKGNEQNLEEFLIRINKKQRIEYIIDTKQLSMDFAVASAPEDIAEFSLDILKNGWGYVSLNIECDGDFIFTEKNVLSDDDFLGNKCTLPIFIDSSVCREGKNFGQVVLFNSHMCVTVPVVVKIGDSAKKAHVDIERKRLVCELMEYFLTFKMKKIGSSTWKKETAKLVDKLAGMNEDDVEGRLFQAQFLISEERYNEAVWILEHVADVIENMDEEEPIYRAYYLYLTSLTSKDEQYVKDVAEQLEGYSRQYPKNWKISWLMLYASDRYDKNPVEKWRLLEEQFDRGCYSPLMYLEAFTVLRNNPAMLRKLDSFEIQVLYFGVKKQLITADLIEQLLYLINKKRIFSGVLFKMLELLYEKKKDPRILQEICTILIKDNRTDNKYFHWYQKGVENNLRVTNLYEYYMMSLDLDGRIDLPKILIMYFAYQNNLDYKRTAYLYNYVYANREILGDVYHSYEPRIERFVLDQIHKLHINKSLAGLYQEILRDEMINEETTPKLAKILFAHLINVEDDRLRKVIVYHSGKLTPDEYAISNLKAWVPLYGNDYTIVFEDGFGNRFFKSVEYTIEKLIIPGRFLKLLGMYDTQNIPLDLYLSGLEQNAITEITVGRYLRLSESEDVNPRLRREYCMNILQYYFELDNLDRLDNYLETVNVEELNMADRAKVIRYLVLRGKKKSAYQWVLKYGPYFVEAKILVRLVGDIIRENNFIYDKNLIAAATYIFNSGKYDSVILEYLVQHVQGMTKKLRDVWKAACSFEIDTYRLAERMIIQMLYSGAFIGEKIDIFKYYVSQGGREDVINAFLKQCSYDYFVRDKITDGYVFEQIRRSFKRGEETDFVCKLAYLKYYAENGDELNSENSDVVEIFLEEMLSEGIHLSFFREYPGMKRLTADMDRLSIVEYRAKPGNRAKIHYVMVHENGESDEYVSEYMTEVYAGVCFKEFILFFGENLQYYITEENGEDEQLTESGNLQKNDMGSDEIFSAYDVINDIIISKTLQDYDTLDDMIENYYRKRFYNTKLFKLK